MNSIYGLADSDAALDCRLYQERYPGRRYPDMKKESIHRHLCEYWDFASLVANRE
jgi:hypothetical protein